MPIPTAALPHRVEIRPRTGTTGQGAPAYGSPKYVPARVTGKRRAVKTSEGVDVVADATCDIRPGLTVPAESRVTTADGRLWEVLTTVDVVELRRPWALQLILQGPIPGGDG